MKRRALVMAGIGSTLWHAAPARSQQSRMARVGWLSYGRPLSGTRNIEAFRNGMRDLGYVEGQNLTIIQRASDGNSRLNHRFPLKSTPTPVADPPWNSVRRTHPT